MSCCCSPTAPGHVLFVLNTLHQSYLLIRRTGTVGQVQLSFWNWDNDHSRSSGFDFLRPFLWHWPFWTQNLPTVVFFVQTLSSSSSHSGEQSWMHKHEQAVELLTRSVRRSLSSFVLLWDSGVPTIIRILTVYEFLDVFADCESFKSSSALFSALWWSASCFNCWALRRRLDFVLSGSFGTDWTRHTQQRRHRPRWNGTGHNDWNVEVN